MRDRLDVELVRRGLARSRRHARDLVTAGGVVAGGRTANRPACPVAPGSAIQVRTGPAGEHVSRAGCKLAGDGPAVAGRRAVVAGAGASTGGFSHVLLHRGVGAVVAVDVGHDQLAPAVRWDVRVRPVERTNVRDLHPGVVDGPVDLTVADLSFMSLTLALPALVRCAQRRADHVLPVKPQFEVGRHRVGSGGIVRNRQAQADAVRSVAAARAHELALVDLTPSPVRGANGNVEYFAWLRHRRHGGRTGGIDAVIAAGVDGATR